MKYQKIYSSFRVKLKLHQMNKNKSNIFILVVLPSVLLTLCLALWLHDEQSITSKGVEPTTPETKDKNTSIHYKALIIPIDDYEHWEDLVHATEEAELLAETLKEDYGFDIERLSNRDATTDEMVNKIDAFFANADANDALLLFFSGHGYWDQTRSEGYWIPANARMPKNGKLFVSDWLWNAALNTAINNSAARHVLVIANACYSASLMQYNPVIEQNESAYENVLNQSSRIGIFSAIGPVPDTELFGRAISDILRANAHDVMTATDLVKNLRPLMRQKSGDTLKIFAGPMPIPSHRGGEFLFVRKDSDITLNASAYRPITEINPLHEDVALLANARMRSSAQKLYDNLKNSDDPEVIPLKILLQETRDETMQLINSLENAEKDQIDTGAIARPRIVALLPPEIDYLDAEQQRLAQLYQKYLYRMISQRPEVTLVDRKTLNHGLKELNISASEIGDPSYKLQIKKLIPARFFIYPQWSTGWSGKQLECFMEIIEIETSKTHPLPGNLQHHKPPEHEIIYKSCEQYVENMARIIAREFPLEAKVEILKENPKRLRAGIGKIHKASQHNYELVQRHPMPNGLMGEHEDKKISPVELIRLEKIYSLFRIEKEITSPETNLWIHEVNSSKFTSAKPD